MIVSFSLSKKKLEGRADFDLFSIILESQQNTIYHITNLHIPVLSRCLYKVCGFIIKYDGKSL